MFSIILGLAFAEILQGFRRLLLQRAGLKLYAPPVIWAFTLVLVLAQTWWAMFSLRDHHIWTFAIYGVVLLETIVLYMVAALALPDLEADGEGDMRAAYYRHAQPFFMLIVCAATVSIVKDLIIDHRLPNTLNLAFQCGFAALAGVAAFWRKPWYHQLLAPTMAVAFLAYIVQLFSRL